MPNLDLFSPADEMLEDRNRVTAALDQLNRRYGHADIALYEGRQYSLVAHTTYRGPDCGGAIQFIAKEGLAHPTITLDKTFQLCRTQQHDQVVQIYRQNNPGR